MTLQLDLPDVTTVFQGFDKIGNLAETYEEINRQDKQAGYTQVSDANALNLTPNATGTNATGGVVSWTKYLSKQQLNSISDKYASNPFEAIQKIFQEVPLVNIDSKEINIKIPALTTDDIKKYQSYLTLRIDKNNKIFNDRKDIIKQFNALCSVQDIKGNLNKGDTLASQIKQLQSFKNPSKAQEEELKKIEALKRKVDTCIKMTAEVDKFISFQENTASLIQSVKQNINVLEQYKQFPTQLYERTHITDRYLTELSAVLSEFMDSTTYRLNTNANRFSSYVDALITLV